MPPVIANAVYDAVEVRIDEVPITPDKVLTAIQARAKARAAGTEEPHRYGPKSVPHIKWPEPMRVKTPWDGGNGKEFVREAVHAKE